MDSSSPRALRQQGEDLINAPEHPIRPVEAPHKLILSRRHWESMRAHVAACLPFEACGLLAGTDALVQEVFPIANQLRSASRFRMEPSEQIRAFAIIESRRMELLGIFHSHTLGSATVDESMRRPSATDIAEAAYPVVQVVWSRIRGPWEAHGYWIEGARVAQVELEVQDRG